MKKLLLAGVAISALVGIAGTAQAGIERNFSGSGASGSLGPGAGQEPWSYGASSPIPPPAGTDVGWGSPGFSQGVTASHEAVTVQDFEITFLHPLDPAEIGIPGAGCTGTETGGTVFCTITGVPWATALSADHLSITFASPATVDDLAPGELYFVNIALLAGTGVSGGAFTGAWTTTTAPEPSSLALLGVGLAGIGAIRRRRRKKT